MRKRSRVILALALLGLASPAAANDFYFGIDGAGPAKTDPDLAEDRAAVANLAAAHGVTGAPTTNKLDPYGLGLFLGYRLTPRTSVELSWTALRGFEGIARAEERTSPPDASFEGTIVERNIDAETRILGLRAVWDFPLTSDIAFFAQLGIARWTRDTERVDQVLEVTAGTTTELFAAANSESRSDIDPLAGVGFRFGTDGTVQTGIKYERFVDAGYRGADVDRFSLVLLLGY